MVLLILYILGINGYGCLIMWRDKQQAVRGGWRISERHLFTAALVGGGAGVWFGMQQYRHKTMRPAFRFGIPCIAILNGVGFAFLLVGLW